MSDDLVERLRARTFSRWESDVQAVMEYEDTLATEAADEIQRLRAVLTFISEADPEDVPQWEMRDRAAEALNVG